MPVQAVFDRFPVIVEMIDRDPLEQLLQPADVIDVVVRREKDVELLDPELVDHIHDSIGVAPSGLPVSMRTPGRPASPERLLPPSITT